MCGDNLEKWEVCWVCRVGRWKNIPLFKSLLYFSRSCACMYVCMYAAIILYSSPWVHISYIVVAIIISLWCYSTQVYTATSAQQVILLLDNRPPTTTSYYDVRKQQTRTKKWAIKNSLLPTTSHRCGVILKKRPLNRHIVNGQYLKMDTLMVRCVLMGTISR